jgi:hypothetical protein
MKATVSVQEAFLSKGTLMGNIDGAYSPETWNDNCSGKSCRRTPIFRGPKGKPGVRFLVNFER